MKWKSHWDFRMELLYTPKAREDLSHIRENVIETWGNVDLAENVLRKITKRVRSLTTFPYMGAEISAITGIKTDYRYLFCEKNYIFYRIETEQVRVIRILNERQDYIKILFGISEIQDTEE